MVYPNDYNITCISCTDKYGVRDPRPTSARTQATDMLAPYGYDSPYACAPSFRESKGPYIALYGASAGMNCV
jgi:hypothetical protein